MKNSMLNAILLVFGVGAVAQVSELVDVDDGTATLYEFYQTDCSTNANTEYTATVTGTILSTYCPKCEGMISSEAASTDNGIYTTYTTVYSQWCSTGATLEPVTYTVTESCSSLSQSRDASYVPQGFTVVTELCNCAEMTLATLTTPIAPALVTPTPASAVTPATAVTGLPAFALAPVANTPAAPAGTPAPIIPVQTMTAIAAPVPAPPAVYSAPAVASALEQPIASPSAGPVAGYVAGPANNSTVNPPIVPAAASSTSVSLVLIGLLSLAGVVQHAL